MTNEEIFDRISNLIKEQLHNEKIEVTVETNIQEDLGIDSIALMEFIITLEDEFNLNIPDEDVEDIQTMGELVDYLSRRLKSS
ncbi:acyl carrier protein [Streptococcus mutans]|uniref:acyl carrier protein n=1 Tax=Streptococcus mutans TaxID=1309 RepID=UPI000466447D|nr:acyl carrier protein [Streptococcus mutans]